MSQLPCATLKKAGGQITLLLLLLPRKLSFVVVLNFPLLIRRLSWVPRYVNGFFQPPPDVSKYITHPAAVQEGGAKKTSPWITDQLFFQSGSDLAATASTTPVSTRREEGEKVLVCPQQSV